MNKGSSLFDAGQYRCRAFGVIWDWLNEIADGGRIMYVDAVVMAGIVTVFLMVLFFVGVGIFVMKDSRDHKERRHGEESHQPGKVV
ncbi:cytochrome c oxidase subunit CcoM [Marinobacter sp. DUT-3]|uniref:cytochrome c oxidase subunit CcoM n=1 Tax=unclassified Marinobacter TaxID=83889 RepID=UPI00387AC162